MKYFVLKFATSNKGGLQVWYCDHFYLYCFQGGKLAHAYPPKDGRTHFDADENWRYHSNRGTELEITATHEFGHALGLGHSMTRGSIMVPFYQKYRSGFQLHADDIAGIQSLYGRWRQKDFTFDAENASNVGIFLNFCNIIISHSLIFCALTIYYKYASSVFVLYTLYNYYEMTELVHNTERHVDFECLLAGTLLHRMSDEHRHVSEERVFQTGSIPPHFSESNFIAYRI